MRAAKAQRLAIQLLGGLFVLGTSQAGFIAQAQEQPQRLISETESIAPTSQTNDRGPTQAVATEVREEEAIAVKETAESSTPLGSINTTAKDTTAKDTAVESIEAAPRLVLSISERRVRLYQGEREVVSYPVAVGKTGWETPTGRFKIYQKVVNPTWRHPWNGSIVGPGPDNPLGYRWAGFLDRGSEAFGFHGTTNESLIGQAVSHGCVRMRNADVEALFEQIEVGTEVIVHR